MKKQIAIALSCLLLSSCLNAQELFSQDVMPLFKESYNQITAFATSNHYSYTKTEKVNQTSFYNFQRKSSVGNYSLQVAFKNHFVDCISVAHYSNDLVPIASDLVNNGFIFISSSTGLRPTQTAGTVYTYQNMEQKLICTIICPVNYLNGNNFFYTNYAPLPPPSE
jgi:hypothetical protein